MDRIIHGDAQRDTEDEHGTGLDRDVEETHEPGGEEQRDHIGDERHDKDPERIE